MYTEQVWKDYLATKPTPENIIQTRITVATRDIILNTIGKLTVYMKPMGDLIISGGEAFNTYFESENQIVTTDIDTKFSPLFRTGPNKLLVSRDPLFFEHLQIAKLILWNKLGQIAQTINDRIRYRIHKLIPGVKALPIAVTRRYTLIQKHKQSTNEKITEGDTLMDIELFALDVHVTYKGQRIDIGGLIDIAFMRPSEIGYDVMYTRQQGIHYHNPLTGKQSYNKNVLLSSKQFLIEDLYLLQKLHLRPQKKSKDKLRMFRFAKYVLGKKVRTSDSIETIFKKCKVKTPQKHHVILSRPIFHLKSWLRRALRINPLKYKKWTTKKTSFLAPGIQGPSGLKIPGYQPTYSNYMYNTNLHKWIRNSSTIYMRNEMNYRPNVPKVTTPPAVPMLYGYKPSRNSRMPMALVNKSIQIGT